MRISSSFAIVIILLVSIFLAAFCQIAVRNDSDLVLNFDKKIKRQKTETETDISSKDEHGCIAGYYWCYKSQMCRKIPGEN